MRINGRMILTRGLNCSKYCLQQLALRYFENRNFKVDEMAVPMNSSISSLSTSLQKNCSFEHIIWLDMEMSGLDINIHQILEIACIITNNDLQVVTEPLNIVVHQSDEVLNNMTEWSLITHTQTGLTNESRLSKITLEEANDIVLNYLKMHVEENKCPLAGNSIHVDRTFLQKYMPAVNSHLHYRAIDVSAIKQLIKIWNINIPLVNKMNVHRALPDIKESIKELQHYKKYIFDAHIKCE